MKRNAYIVLGGIGVYGLMGLGIVLVCVGGYTLLAQVILWLKSGEWVSLPLLYLFVDPWPLLAEKLSDEALVAIQRARRILCDPLIILRMGFHTYFSRVSAWLMDPHDWVGIQKIIRQILETIPLSLFLVGSGAAIWKTAVIERELAQLENLSNESA